MPDIRHILWVKAPAGKILPIVSSAEHWVRLWSTGASVGKDGSVRLTSTPGMDIVDFSLWKTFNRTNAQWNCSTADSVIGGTAIFSLVEEKSSTMIKFFHARWPKETVELMEWNTLWGAFLIRLKAEAEDSDIKHIVAPGDLVQDRSRE